MDSYASDQLTETKDLSAPPGDLLRRGRIESVLSDAEEAVEGSRQESTEQVDPLRSFVNTGSPVRAPQTQEKISPVEVKREDGFVPADEETVRERFAKKTFSVFRVSISHVLPDIDFGEDVPASVVYQFNEPISSVDGEFLGQLYAFDYSEDLSEFVPGRKVKRVVQVVSESGYDGDLPPKTETYQAEVGADGVARWEESSDDQS